MHSGPLDPEIGAYVVRSDWQTASYFFEVDSSFYSYVTSVVCSSSSSADVASALDQLALGRSSAIGRIFASTRRALRMLALERGRSTPVG